MADVTFTVGNTGADYSTWNAWKADLDDGGIYNAGDNPIGNQIDDVFDSGCTLNTGDTLGVNTAKITVQEASRHGGIQDGGVKTDFNGNGFMFSCQDNINYIIEYQDFEASGQIVSNFVVSSNFSTTKTVIVRQCIGHDGMTAFGGFSGFNVSTSVKYNVSFLNNICYKCASTQNSGSAALMFYISGTAGRTRQMWNNTGYNLNRDNGTGNAFIFAIADSATVSMQNNIGGNVGGTSSGTMTVYDSSSYSSATVDHNMSDDGTASGTGSLASETMSAIFENITDGSENFNLKTGSNAIEAGIDLGTTNGVNVDAAGNDRDTAGITWGMGALDVFPEASGFLPRLTLLGVG